MSDAITLTIPAGDRYRGIATLVLGGLGSRLDLPYERVDDLQLAVLSMLEACETDSVSLNVESNEERLLVAIGPLSETDASDGGLTRVLEPLVDSVEPSRRDDGFWMTLELVR
jgi:hypothetical protein